MTEQNDQNKGATSDYRRADGTFGPGSPGRPKGARHRVTRAVESLLEGEAEGLTRKAVEMALEGDTVALRLCLERIAPARKDAPVEFDLPPMSSAKEAARAAQSVLAAVADSQLTPLEGASIMALVDGYRKTLETSEFEARIAELEKKK